MKVAKILKDEMHLLKNRCFKDIETNIVNIILDLNIILQCFLNYPYLLKQTNLCLSL